MRLKQTLAVCFLTASCALAGTVLQQLQITDAGVLPPEGGAFSVSVPRFNPALGRFVSMFVMLSIDVEQTATYTNPFDSPRLFVFGAGANLWVDPKPPLVAGGGDHSESGYQLDLGASETGSFVIDENAYKTFDYAGILPAEFLGPGSFTMSGYLSAWMIEDILGVTPDSVGNLAWSADGFIGENHSYVIYEFEPVPEPSSRGLMLIGLGFLVSRLRRRTRLPR